MIWTPTHYKSASEPDSAAHSATEVFSQQQKQPRLLRPRRPRLRWRKSYDLVNSRRFYLHVLGAHLRAWRKGWKVSKSFRRDTLQERNGWVVGFQLFVAIPCAVLCCAVAGRQEERSGLVLCLKKPLCKFLKYPERTIAIASVFG